MISTHIRTVIYDETLIATREAAECLPPLVARNLRWYNCAKWNAAVEMIVTESRTINLPISEAVQRLITDTW